MKDDEKDKENKEKKPKGKKRRIIAAAVAGTLGVAALVAGKEGYDYVFRRYDRPDYAVTPGLCCIERCDLSRNEMSFYSDGVRLQGYYYPCETAKGLVVICHGLHAGADNYIAIAEYMVKSGYAVFSFDYKGTYSSDGDSCVGMCESLVDLDHALDYIEREPTFDGMPLFLIGHSWGGYAAAAVLSLHKTVSACACIAAPNSGYTLFLEKGEQYGGAIASKGIPETFLNTYQLSLFGKYIKYDAVGGINSTDIPVLIAHGKADSLIDIGKQAIVAHSYELRHDNVTYHINDGGHNSVWHSEASAKYSEEVDAKLKAMKKSSSYEEIKNYVSTVDHRLYSEVNADLFGAITEMFDSTVRR